MNRARMAYGGFILAASLVVIVAVMGFSRIHSWVIRMGGQYSIQDRVQQFETANERVREHFRGQGVDFPPRCATLLVLKQERRVEVRASAADETPKWIVSYPVLGASGTLGPKLREGDLQVPEGIYAVEALNPNSRFHVALRVGYPNEFDRHMAERDGRTQLGGDIMIHGGSSSIGCVAVGDDAAEELFLIAALTGIENVTILISTVDLRRTPLPEGLDKGWRHQLYSDLTMAVQQLQ